MTESRYMSIIELKTNINQKSLNILERSGLKKVEKSRKKIM